MKRRGFLGAVLGLIAAPAVVGLDPAVGADRMFVLIKHAGCGWSEPMEIYDGLQWSPEDIDELRKRGAGTLVINKVRPLVDAALARMRGSVWA